MQIDYNILWIEDSVSWLNGRKTKIETHIQSKGFAPHIDTLTNVDEFICDVELIKKYDLIFMDYQLDTQGQKTKGDEIIKIIRNHNIYSNIIFYSNQDLPKIAYENNIQNVFIFQRAEFRNDSIETVYNVIDFILGKANSINVMRGIVMAELAKFDNDILNIINKTAYEQKWEKIFDLITLNRQKNCRDIIAKDNSFAQDADAIIMMCEAIRNKNNIDNLKSSILNSPKSSAIFSSSVRADFLNKILNDNRIILQNQNDFKSKFREEIIDIRNELAHYQNLENYTEEKLLTIRKNILKHRENLKEIERLLVDNTVEVV